MAQYENLPVFKATYDLLLDLYKTLNNVPRDIRYTLVQDLKNELTQLMVLIYKANSQREKTATLRKCLDLFLSVRLRIRLLKDMHFLSVARFAELYIEATNRLAQPQCKVGNQRREQHNDMSLAFNE